MEIIGKYSGGWEYSVDFDKSGSPFIAGSTCPLPFYLESGHEFIEYTSPTLKGLRTADARDAAYRLQSLRRPGRPNVAPVAKPVEPARPLTLREQAFALQENPLEVVPMGNETGSPAYRRAAAERGDQVARLLDKERQQHNSENWGKFSPGQQALNESAKAASQAWFDQQKVEFAKHNGGHVIGSNGRAES